MKSSPTGILEFKNGNTFGTVAFTSYGLFLVVVCVSALDCRRRLDQAASGQCRGPDPLNVGVFTAYMWIATFRASFCIWTVFLLLWITFFLLAGGDLGMGSGWHTAGGWVGILTGLDALYVSFAEVTNATFKKNVLPLGAPIVRP